MFAAHDYTILSLLSAVGLLSHLSTSVQFSGYVIFELWGQSTTLLPLSNTTNTNASKNAANTNIATTSTTTNGSSITTTASVDSTDESQSKSPPRKKQQTFISGIDINNDTDATIAENRIEILLDDKEEETMMVSEKEKNNNKIQQHVSNESNQKPILKIIYNFQPFDFILDLHKENKDISHLYVHENKEIVVAEWSMLELKLKIEYVCDELIKRGRGIPPGFLLPEFISTYTDNEQIKI